MATHFYHYVDILRPSKNIKTKIIIATSVTSQTEMSVFDVTKFLSIKKKLSSFSTLNVTVLNLTIQITNGVRE